MVIDMEGSGREWQRVVANGKNALFNPKNHLGAENTRFGLKSLSNQK